MDFVNPPWPTPGPKKKLLPTGRALPMVRRKCTVLWAGKPDLPAKDKTQTKPDRRRNSMKVNKWTLGLAAAGLVSLPALAQAEEKASQTVMTALSSTTISGYVDTSAHWDVGTGNANP